MRRNFRFVNLCIQKWTDFVAAAMFDLGSPTISHRKTLKKEIILARSILKTNQMIVQVLKIHWRDQHHAWKQSIGKLIELATSSS